MTSGSDIRLVPAFKANRFIQTARKQWDLFYKRNTTNFFKDREWTLNEFSELSNDTTSARKGMTYLLEIGCGVGNFVFPLIRKNENLFIYCCDFSPRAVDFVKQNEFYASSGRVTAFVADLIAEDSNPFASYIEHSLNYVSLIFVMSALPPSTMNRALANISALLKPGAVILFRDYAEGDMAQRRFEQSSDAKKVEDGLYLRQDGTLSYFFTQTFLSDLFRQHGFDILEMELVSRNQVNRKEQLALDRIFLQAKFVKI